MTSEKVSTVRSIEPTNNRRGKAKATKKEKRTLESEAVLDPLHEVEESRRGIWEYYGLSGFSSDGYPQSVAPLDKTKTVEHPMHGAYLIVEYINNYLREGRRDKTYLHKAMDIAHGAVKRMEQRGNALCFIYRAGQSITPQPHDFYSSLTQAKYLEAFVRLHAYAKDDWLLEMAGGIFNSFEIPVEKGGVLLRNKWGVFIEEYPTEVPSYVLNGWMTTLNEIFHYAYLVKNKDALKLARESAASLVALLPSFDMPEMYISRYKLSGFVPMKVFFKEGPPPTVESVTISTGGVTIVSTPEEARRYGTLQLVESDGGAFSFKSTLSMIDYPNPNSVILKVRAAEPVKAQWSVGVARFDPRFPTPRAAAMRQLKMFDIKSGTSELEIEIPWDLTVPWVANAVPFSKVIGGKFHNAYHFLHIKALTQMYEYYKTNRVLYWRDRWMSYVDAWPDFQPYKSSDMSHHAISKGEHPTEREYLIAPRIRLVNGVPQPAALLLEERVDEDRVD